MPNGLGFILMLFLIYLIFRNKYDVGSVFIILFFIGFLCIFHPIIAVSIIFLLTLYHFIIRVKSNPVLKIQMALIAGIITIVWWMYASNDFLDYVKVIKYAFSQNEEIKSIVIQYSPAPIQTFLAYFGFVVLLSMGVLGFLLFDERQIFHQ